MSSKTSGPWSTSGAWDGAQVTLQEGDYLGEPDLITPVLEKQGFLQPVTEKNISEQPPSDSRQGNGASGPLPKELTSASKSGLGSRFFPLSCQTRTQPSQHLDVGLSRPSAEN